MSCQQTFLFATEPPSPPLVAPSLAAPSRRKPTAPSRRKPAATIAAVRPEPPAIPAADRRCDFEQDVDGTERTGDRIDRLRQMVRQFEGRGVKSGELHQDVFSTGGEWLDRLLPHGGLRPGTMVEWVCDRRRHGATLLAMLAAAEIIRHRLAAGRPLVVADGWAVDGNGSGESFYPPAAIALGIPAERMVIFRKGRGHRRADLVWALDQALRGGAAAAVFAEIGDWLDPTDARRLQLAAETGGTMLLLVRPTASTTSHTSSGRAADVPASGRAVRPTAKPASLRTSFADIRWTVSPLAGHGGRRLRVELAKCRGGVSGVSRTIEIDPRPGMLGGTGRRGDAADGPAVVIRDLTGGPVPGGRFHAAATAMVSDLAG